MSCRNSIRLASVNRVSRALLALWLLALVAGCATHPPAQLPDAATQDQMWASRHAQLSEMSVWAMSGRVAVKSEGDSWSASMRWQQSGELFDISFSSPLGQQMARLTGDDVTASLYLPDKRVLSAPNVSDLLDGELGWHVPIAGLRYWLVGLPAPGSESSSGLDGRGRLAWLEQSEWYIEYSRYRSARILELPEKMVLTRNDLRVRLVIDRWLAGEALHAASDLKERSGEGHY